MTSRIIVVDPFDYVVFGGTGDLARRKLLPALFHREVDGQLPEEARIIGVSRRGKSDAEYRNEVRAALESFVKPAERPDEIVEKFLGRIHYVAADATSSEGWKDLAALLKEGAKRVRAFYLATGPDLFGPISERIKEAGLITNKTRVVVEKPLGKDLKSAKAINDEIGKIFHEDQIYRIDHYLGKETVQKPDGAALCERAVRAAVELRPRRSRADHRRRDGGRRGPRRLLRPFRRAARHGAEPHPAAPLPRRHGTALLHGRGRRPRREAEGPEGAEADRRARPGRQLRARPVPRRGGPVRRRAGYIDEITDKDSRTETFVALKAEVENWRWAGVPFYLRTGKRLAARMSEVVVRFKPVPHSIFDGSAGALAANELVIRLQPDEGVKLQLMIKDPGPGGMRLSRVPLDMSFADAFKARNPDAYERLLLDVIRGNATLFMHRDEVEAAWTWIDPIRQGWDESSQTPKQYTAGTWGPSAAIALIERDGRTWHEDGF